MNTGLLKRPSVTALLLAILTISMVVPGFGLQLSRTISTTGSISYSKKAFIQEIERLRSLLNMGYLQRDSRIPAIRGVTFKPALMKYDQATIIQEAQAVASLGLNTVRIDWWAAGDLDAYLTLMNQYGIKTIILTPYPIDPADDWYHYDPFDKFTVEDWKAKLTPFLQKYANDSRIYALEIIGEPLIKPEHYQQMIEIGQWVKNNCIQEVTIGLNLPELVQPLAPAVSVISFHAYGLSLLRNNQSIIELTDLFRQAIQGWKQYGKPILIEETGFPTWFYWIYGKSNLGNTPYLIDDSLLKNGSTPETEALQYAYLSNMLHVIKDEEILGYLIYMWCDDLPFGEGGWGMKTGYPELREKPAMALIP